MLGIVRQPMTSQERKIAALFVASEILFVIVGYVVGNSLATDNRAAIGVFGAGVGGIVWLASCWLLRFVMWARRKRHALAASHVG
jgi:hypothetical protein